MTLAVPYLRKMMWLWQTDQDVQFVSRAASLADVLLPRGRNKINRLEGEGGKKKKDLP